MECVFSYFEVIDMSMRWQVKRCPRCDSKKVVYEVEGQIRFRITDAGFVQIESTPEELVETVDDILFEDGAMGYCEKCGLTFKG